jgi:hypothetical protein
MFPAQDVILLTVNSTWVVRFACLSLVYILLTTQSSVYPMIYVGKATFCTLRKYAFP